MYKQFKCGVVRLSDDRHLAWPGNKYTIPHTEAYIENRYSYTR